MEGAQSRNGPLFQKETQMATRQRFWRSLTCALILVGAGSVVWATQQQQPPQEKRFRPDEPTATAPAQDPRVDRLWQQIDKLQKQILDHEIAAATASRRETPGFADQEREKTAPARRTAQQKADSGLDAPSERPELELAGNAAVDQMWQQIGELHKQIVVIRVSGKMPAPQTGRPSSGRAETTPGAGLAKQGEPAREAPEQPSARAKGDPKPTVDPLWQQIGRLHAQVVEREVAGAVTSQVPQQGAGAPRGVRPEAEEEKPLNN
jgi:hypothetical protein